MEEGTYIRRERRFGSFQRSFDVSGIDERGITAGYDSGVLSVRLPKVKPAEPETDRITIDYVSRGPVSQRLAGPFFVRGAVCPCKYCILGR